MKNNFCDFYSATINKVVKMNYEFVQQQSVYNGIIKQRTSSKKPNKFLSTITIYTINTSAQVTPGMIVGLRLAEFCSTNLTFACYTALLVKVLKSLVKLISPLYG